MWRAPGNSMNSDSDEDSRRKTIASGQLDSGYGDSGFLSNSNLPVSGDLAKRLVDAPKRPDEMKNRAISEVIMDSGLDIADNLSRMDLEGNGEGASKQSVQLSNEQDIDNGNAVHQALPSHQYVRPDNNVNSLGEYLAKDEDGDTLLHNSIIHSYYNRTFQLIVDAPDPAVLSSLNKNGHSPLHLAVLAQQSGIVRLLALSGANLIMRSNAGNTALHLACKLGHVQCAKALLDPIDVMEHAFHIKANRKAISLPQNLELKNYIGQTCIHVATLSGSVPIVRLLLHMGADLEAREGLSGRTALMLAIIEGKREVVDFFLEECRPNFETENYAGFTAYQVALSVGNYELANRMLALGAIAEPLPEVDYSSSDEDMEDEDYMGGSDG